METWSAFSFFEHTHCLSGGAGFESANRLSFCAIQETIPTTMVVHPSAKTTWTHAINLAEGVHGKISPYPKVAAVTTDKYKKSPTLASWAGACVQDCLSANFSDLGSSRHVTAYRPAKTNTIAA